MSLEEFLLRPSQEHEAARIASGLVFLEELRKQAAAAVPVPKQEFNSSTAALNTKLPDTPPYPVAAGQRVGQVRASKPRTPDVRKLAALQYVPSAAKKVGGGLFDAVSSDFRGLRDSAEGYRAGVSQYTSGKLEKPDLGSKWARFKAWVTRKKTPEQLAYEKGPAYYNAFIRGKKAQQGLGAGDLLDELNVNMRNYENKFTPFSVTRGALTTGLVGPETLGAVASKSLRYASGQGDEAANATRMKRIATGVGIGAGGLLAGGMLAKGMQKRNDNSK